MSKLCINCLFTNFLNSDIITGDKFLSGTERPEDYRMNFSGVTMRSDGTVPSDLF